MRKIVGVVGHPLAGKDAVSVELERRHGFMHVSTGDVLRQHMTAAGIIPGSRLAMADAGRELRATEGADALVRFALASLSPDKDVVLSGLRAVPEAHLVKSLGGVIVAVEAPLEVRYRRASDRARRDDRVTFEEFTHQQSNEARGSEEGAQNVDMLIEMADYRIDNGGSAEEIPRRVDDLIAWLNRNDHTQGNRFRLTRGSGG